VIHSWQQRCPDDEGVGGRREETKGNKVYKLIGHRLIFLVSTKPFFLRKERRRDQEAYFHKVFFEKKKIKVVFT